MSVNLGAGQFAVAQHLLDEANIGSAFQHQRRHAVPEKMTGTLSLWECLVNQPSAQPAQVVRRKGAGGPGSRGAFPR